MAGLPTQLDWRRFLCVLRSLGYELQHQKRGAARTFYHPNRNPPLVTFHEPHGGDTLRLGTLREYLRKLNLSPADFLERLRHC
ncbi:MAG: type II toxin-antitoxin system HicA family toxin [Terriglobales bacterium]